MRLITHYDIDSKRRYGATIETVTDTIGDHSVINGVTEVRSFEVTELSVIDQHGDDITSNLKWDEIFTIKEKCIELARD